MIATIDWKKPRQRRGLRYVAMRRWLQTARDSVERGAEICAHERHCTDYHYRNETGDQAVFNGRDSRFIVVKPRNYLKHWRSPFPFTSDGWRAANYPYTLP
jgi:hypothetical protein